jgi:hypothetical protein
MDNGPSRELRGDFRDEMVYCVDCGNIYVWDKGRKCPACHLAARLDKMEVGEE